MEFLGDVVLSIWNINFFYKTAKQEFSSKLLIFIAGYSELGD